MNRPLLSLLLAAAAPLCLWAAPPARELSLTERFEAQRAIDRIYYSHQIGATEPFEQAVPREVSEAKVRAALKLSVALETLWSRPLTASMLEAELQRIQDATKAPDRLRAIFQALDNDPFLILEAVARPLLAERLARPLVDGGSDSAFDIWYEVAADQLDERAASTIASDAEALPMLAASGASFGGPCVADDAWSPTATTTLTGRSDHTAIWTGTHMIIWGGFSGSGYLNTGSRYDPALDSWSAVSTMAAPAARAIHTAVWTGTHMVIWGGRNASAGLASGGRYNPATNAWLGVVAGGAPSARAAHTAVWTGSVMVVWGGSGGNGFNTYLNNGARYNPANNTWSMLTTASTPPARRFHSAVWTGTEMIVWGGYNGSNYLSTGGRYNPAANSWAATSITGQPAGRYQHAAVWSGSQMLIWAGFDGNNFINSGGRYDPAANSWSSMTTAGAPSPRYYPLGVWTGTRMIVWGGHSGAALGTGGRYDPSADSWSGVSTTGAPEARLIHKGVWTGSEMILWGGTSGANALSSGGHYTIDESPDTDGDGAKQCGDCDDTNALVYPGAPQICDGLNNDCNDATWPALLSSDRDSDGDGVLTCQDDCNDADPSSWATPDEAEKLTVAGNELTWEPPIDGGGLAPRYDLLRAGGPAGFAAGAVCQETDVVDQRATDPETPAPGGIFYYLVRAENNCPAGTGSLGTDSAGAPRAGRACP